MRDETGVAAIVADDVSLSHDGDEIAQDGIIYDQTMTGFLMKRPQRCDGNDTQLIYTTKKSEHIGDSYCKEHFVTISMRQKNYLRDDTADAPESSCIIRVLNEAPEVSSQWKKLKSRYYYDFRF